MNVLEKILEEMDTEMQKQRELCKDLKGTPGYRLYEKVASVFKGIVTKHMDEVENDNWIPVSERLPEEGKEVLAQFVVRVRNMNNQVYEKTVYIYPLHYEKGTLKSFAVVPNGKVVAWKPLPEPYKGGDEK